MLTSDTSTRHMVLSSSPSRWTSSSWTPRSLNHRRTPPLAVTTPPSSFTSVPMAVLVTMLLASIGLAAGHDDLSLPSPNTNQMPHDHVDLHKMNEQTINSKQTMTSFLRMSHSSYQTSPRAAMIADRSAPTTRPINLISDLFFEGQEMCMSLSSTDSDSAILAVCDGSNIQKWYNVGNTLQSFINEDMCLDAGESASPGAFLSTVQCDESSSQDWTIDTTSSTIVNAEHSTLIMADGCSELSSDNTNILIQSILAGSNGNWTQLGSDFDGESAVDWLGYSTAVSSDGSIIAFGVPYEDVSGEDAGQVRVYSYDESINAWTQLGARIDAEARADHFGWSVSLASDGMTLAVGAHKNDGNGIESGHARVYSYDESTNAWTQLGADIDGEGALDASGFSVSLASDSMILAVGAPHNDDGNGYRTGHVRVFSYDESNNAWTQLGDDIDGEGLSDYAGKSVSLASDGMTLAVGAVDNDGNGSNSGHVRVFSYDESNNTWNQLGADIDGEAAMDFAGKSVSLSSDGKTLAIGAYENDDNGDDSGHVRVYSYDESNNAWTQFGADIDGEAAGDLSGVSVSLASDGKTLAVGAHLNDGNGSNSGHVRVYSYDESTNAWTQLGSDIDGEAAEDRSGYSVSLASDSMTLVVGAHHNDANGDNSGHVRVYSMIATESTCEDQKKWTTKTTNFDFGITRTGDAVSIEDHATEATQKLINVDYKLADPRYKDDVNITIFKDDCLTTLGSAVLPFEKSFDGSICTLSMTYNPDYIENSDIWSPTSNGAGDVTGGSFTFCARAAVVDVQSGYEMDFNETKFLVKVTMTTGTDFSLAVEVDRDDAGEEDAGDVDYSGSVRGFQCDVDSFSENAVAVVQGSSLGLCVESTAAVDGIVVAGWQTLTLSRDGFDFRAISDGVVPAALSNLVNPNCDSITGRCVSEVELVAVFFDTDGALTVDGTVVLGFPSNDGGAGSRRRLAKVHAEINRSDETLVHTRKLDEDGEGQDTTTAEGSFALSVSVVSDNSSSAATATSLSLIVSFGIGATTMIYTTIGFMY